MRRQRRMMLLILLPAACNSADLHKLATPDAELVARATLLAFAERDLAGLDTLVHPSTRDTPEYLSLLNGFSREVAAPVARSAQLVGVSIEGTSDGTASRELVYVLRSGPSQRISAVRLVRCATRWCAETIALSEIGVP